MQHGVAIGTDRAQVPDRINGVFFIVFGYGPEVMYMNVALTYARVHLSHVFPTHLTTRPVVLDAFPARVRISFIAISRRQTLLAFAERLTASLHFSIHPDFSWVNVKVKNMPIPGLLEALGNVLGDSYSGTLWMPVEAR